MLIDCDIGLRVYELERSRLARTGQGHDLEATRTAATTSTVFVPMEPVEPRMASRFIPALALPPRPGSGS